MKDFHRILEIPTDATEEQIRVQYKRLVRIYHPDRFTNPQDKVYVEQKLKDITDAYHALLEDKSEPDSALFSPLSTQEPLLVPKPVVLPTRLDFGSIVKGAQQTLHFQVQNEGGLARKLQLHYHDEQSWFKVTKGRRLHKTRPFPMEFAVIVDTNHLQGGKTYHGWVCIEMDGVSTQLALSTKVRTRTFFVFLSPRIALAISMLALLIALAGMQYFDLVLPNFSQNPPSFRSVQIAVQQFDTSNVPVPSLSESTIADFNSVGQGGQSVTSQPPALGDTLPPSATPGARTTVPGAIIIEPLATTSFEFSSATPSLESAATPLAELSGRTGAKPPVTKVLLPPPVESWAQTAIPHSNRTTLDLTPTIAVTSTAISRRNVLRRTPVTEEPASRTQSLPLTLTLLSTAALEIAPPRARVASTSAMSAATNLVMPPEMAAPRRTFAVVTSITEPLATPIASSTTRPITPPVPTASQTLPPTHTPAPTATEESTAVPTATVTGRANPTATSTAVVAPTAASTRTQTATAIPTLTPTFTSTATLTHTPSPVFTPTSTVTPTRTPTKSATWTLTPSPSPTSTATQVATPTFPTIAVGSAVVLIPDNYNVNARAENSTTADVLQVLGSGTQWLAVGRTIDNTWVLIRLDNEQYAWVFVETVITDPDQVALLPIVVTAS